MTNCGHPMEFWDRVRQHRTDRRQRAARLLPTLHRGVGTGTAARSSLRLVIVGGDVFPVETLPTWRASGVRVVNAYGPTEAVITATVHDVSYQSTACARVPIGRPKPGMSAYVLDESGRFAPLGVPGELYLARPDAGRWLFASTRVDAQPVRARSVELAAGRRGCTARATACAGTSPGNSNFSGVATARSRFTVTAWRSARDRNRARHASGREGIPRRSPPGRVREIRI